MKPELMYVCELCFTEHEQFPSNGICFKCDHDIFFEEVTSIEVGDDIEEESEAA